MEYCVLAGQAWTRDAVDGAELVADNGRGGRPIVITAAGGQGFTVDLDPGRWWIAERPDADSPLVRLGTLDVVPLADPFEVRLIEELAELDRALEGDVDAIATFQKANATGGEAETRSTMMRIREARRSAESRLADYRNRKAGRSPVGYARRACGGGSPAA